VGTYLGVTAFHIAGGLLAIWALTVTALGLRSGDFPRSSGQARLVGTISVLLALGAISSAIIVGALESDEEEGGEAKAKPAAEETAPAPGPGALQLAADPSGQLKFDKTALQAKAGTVTIAMKNPSPLDHNVSIEGKGVEEKGNVVKDGGTSTVKAQLKPGRYTFYCSVDGHEAAGMKGTLTVR
jgi:plastocyanin